MSQRLRIVGNVRTTISSAMRPGWVKRIETVHIMIYCDSPETDIGIAANAGCLDYADTWPSKHDHWLSQRESTNRSTANYLCEETVEFDTAFASVGIPITRIHPWVTQGSMRQWLPATLHNTGWMEYHQECHGSDKANPILDFLDGGTANSYSASSYRCVQWHVRSYGWHYASFNQEGHSVEGKLILHSKVRAPDAAPKLCWSYFEDWYAFYFNTYSGSFREVVMVQEEGQWNV
jgi:hypothetical protein